MINKEDLITRLKELNKFADEESAHFQADLLLINYIDDKEIEEAYNKIEKWYA